MERLTKVDNQGRLLAYSVSDTGLPAIIMSGNPYHELIERLKSYEDTGLEPEEILALKRRERWVPVQERLPDEGQEVLASNGRYEYLEEYDSNYKFMDGMIAWMPLPEHFKP